MGMLKRKYLHQAVSAVVATALFMFSTTGVGVYASDHLSGEGELSAATAPATSTTTSSEDCTSLLRTQKDRLLRGQLLTDTTEPDIVRLNATEGILQELWIPALDQLLEDELATPFGRFRWRHRVRHPGQSVEALRDMQAAYMALADDHELRAKIANVMSELRAATSDSEKEVLASLEPQASNTRRDRLAKTWFGVSVGVTAVGFFLGYWGLPLVGVALGWSLGRLQTLNAMYNTATRDELEVLEPFVRAATQLGPLLETNSNEDLRMLGEIFGRDRLEQLYERYSKTAPKTFHKFLSKLGLSSDMAEDRAEGFTTALDGMGITAVTLPSLHKAIEQYRLDLFAALSALSELDVNMAIAGFMNRQIVTSNGPLSYRDIYFPQSIRDEPEAYLKVVSGTHPQLLNDMDKVMLHSFELSPQKPIILVVGAGRKGGRSFIRTAGFNAYAAQIGFPSAGRVDTSLIRQILVKFETNGTGEKSFQAQGDRIIQMVNQASSGEPTLIVMDRLAEGSLNPEEVEGCITFLEYIIENTKNTIAVIGTDYLDFASFNHEKVNVMVVAKEEDNFGVGDGHDPNFHIADYLAASGLPAKYLERFKALSEGRPSVRKSGGWLQQLWKRVGGER